jgi:hypothetical protein
MSIKVDTIRATRDGVYIGRYNSRYGLAASPLGNPYKVTPDVPREKLLEQYRAWLDEQLACDTPARREIERLTELARQGDITLLCWCTPLSCHGDIVRAVIEARLG